MQSIEHSDSRNPRLGEHRKKVAERLSIFFPANISDLQHGLIDAGQLVASGVGLVIVVNHFSWRDGPGGLVYVAAQSDAMADKPWLAPVARHISDVAEYLNQKWKTEVDIKPVVTASTIKKPKYAHLPQGYGLIDYIREATRTLDRGGVVILFPQTSRKTYLAEPGPKERAMKLLFDSTEITKVKDFGVLPVGLGIKGVKDYSKRSWINFGIAYDVNIGRLWLKNEVLQSAEEAGRSLDAWMTDQLRLLVPENYRKIPQSADIFTEKASKLFMLSSDNTTLSLLKPYEGFINTEVLPTDKAWETEREADVSGVLFKDGDRVGCNFQTRDGRWFEIDSIDLTLSGYKRLVLEVEKHVGRVGLSIILSGPRHENNPIWREASMTDAG